MGGPALPAARRPAKRGPCCTLPKGIFLLHLLALARATTSVSDPCGSTAGCTSDRRDAPHWSCTFSTGVIIDPHSQAEQRVYAADGGGLLSTNEECATRAKAEHPAATGATFTVVGYSAGRCFAEFGTIRATQHTNYDSCLYAPSASPSKGRAILMSGSVVTVLEALVLDRPNVPSSNGNPPARRVARQSELCTLAPTISPPPTVLGGWGGGWGGGGQGTCHASATLRYAIAGTGRFQGPSRSGGV